MKIHWMDRGSPSVDELKILLSKLDEVGYESVLTVYDSVFSDKWMKSAFSLNLNHKTKYMIALRPYSISPELAAMMVEAFNEYAPDRLIFNIVAGDILNHETSIDDVVDLDISTPEKRTEYPGNWLEKFKKIKIMTKIPEMGLAGISDNTLKNAKKYGDFPIAMLHHYFQYPEKYKDFKRIMVSFAVVIRETQKEADDFIKNLPNEWEANWTIWGNKKEVYDKIYELKKMGVTDILISTHPKDDKIDLIHNFAKIIIDGEKNGSI